MAVGQPFPDNFPMWATRRQHLVRHLLRCEVVPFRIDGGRVPADRRDEKVLAETAFGVLGNALGEFMIATIAGWCCEQWGKPRRAPRCQRLLVDGRVTPHLESTFGGF
jgi:hypothetical protein